jgi:aspartate/methionine/tyrosine aminotransferase
LAPVTQPGEQGGHVVRKLANSSALRHFGEQVQSPFARLRGLLAGMEPGLAPIDMTIGEPRHAMPDFLAEALREAFAGYAKYPPIQGTPELLSAIGGWIGRRYPAVAGAIDPARRILPLNGSREGLFSAIFPAIARRPDLTRPAVLMPNPFYQAYLAAAIAGGAEPVFLDTGEASGFLPDLEAIPAPLLARTAAFYLASPANPQGAVAGPAYLARAIELAREHDFLLFLDECYSEIYLNGAPHGGLETAYEAGGDFANILVFNSLSKRSNVPGLRSGFIAGDEAVIAAFARFRNVAAPQIPLPVQHASARLWSEDAHVERSRALYRAKFAAAKDILKPKFDYAEPAGAFFLWLKMDRFGGGEAAAKTFWKECGVKLLPGAYLAQTESTGRNPGADYVRVALVDDLALTRQALQRLASYLS